MHYDLAEIAKRAGLRRKIVTFRPIEITSALINNLAAINRKMLRPWLDTANRTRIVEVYTAELDRRLQRDAIDELTSLLDALGGEVTRLILDLTPELQDWGFDVEGWHRGKWSRTVLAGTQVDISTVIGPADATETIEVVLVRNTSLVKNISDEARAKIADLVYRGLQQRTPPRIVAREIAQIQGISRRRAVRIASDQATKLASALDAQRQREAGLTIWQWNHSGKLHFRPEHKDRDGNLYADEKEDQGVAPNGKTVLAPPDDDDLPGIPPFCGCTRQGVLILPS